MAKRDGQIAVNLMQRVDPGDDLFLSPSQTVYHPYPEKSAIVLARTVGTGNTLIMRVLELPDSLQPVSQFSSQEKLFLASLHESIVVNANRDEIDARIIREGNELFTQRFFQEF